MLVLKRRKKERITIELEGIYLIGTLDFITKEKSKAPFVPLSVASLVDGLWIPLDKDVSIYSL